MSTSDFVDKDNLTTELDPTSGEGTALNQSTPFVPTEQVTEEGGTVLEDFGQTLFNVASGGAKQAADAAEERSKARGIAARQSRLRNQAARRRALEQSIQQRAQIRTIEAQEGVESSSAEGAKAEATSDLSSRLAKQAQLRGLEERRIDRLEEAAGKRAGARKFRAIRGIFGSFMGAGG